MEKQRIFSLMVGNAFADPALVEKMGLPDAATRRHLTVLLQTHYNGTTLLTTLCGGQFNRATVDRNFVSVGVPADSLFMTDMGELTLKTALAFVAPGKAVIFRELTCTCGKERMKEKIYEGLALARQGDLVIFLGDIAGNCDGKILPWLNLVPGQPMVILPRYKEEETQDGNGA